MVVVGSPMARSASVVLRIEALPKLDRGSESTGRGVFPSGDNIGSIRVLGVPHRRELSSMRLTRRMDDLYMMIECMQVMTSPQCG